VVTHFDDDRVHPAPLDASLRWILGHAHHENIIFLAHLGDLTQNGLPSDFAAISRSFGVLDQARAGYSVLADKGYTIEAFVKLPPDFDGSHAWCGLFSRMGSGALGTWWHIAVVNDGTQTVSEFLTADRRIRDAVN
jgi:hypothetical protein